MKNKWLFTIDLDGTLLKNSATGELNKEDKIAIRKLIDAKNIVCIVTGRPWRSTKKTYNELELKTIVGNYNGAFIHNPSDYGFIPETSYMNLNDVMYILGDKKLKKNMSNIAIEGPGWVMIKKRDKDLERVFGFSSASSLKEGLNFHKLPLKPTGVILDTKPGVNILELQDYLSRTYGDLVEFSSWSKGEGLTPVFDMTNVGITKSKAVSLLSRYYNIPLKRTIAIGDGYNDVPMFKTAEISVAMQNASKDIKDSVTYVTNRTNKEGGIAEFINKFLDHENGKKFIEKLRNKRKKMNNIKVEITSSH